MLLFTAIFRDYLDRLKHLKQKQKKDKSLSNRAKVELEKEMVKGVLEGYDIKITDKEIIENLISEAEESAELIVADTGTFESVKWYVGATVIPFFMLIFTKLIENSEVRDAVEIGITILFFLLYGLAILLSSKVLKNNVDYRWKANYLRFRSTLKELLLEEEKDQKKKELVA